MALTKPPLMVVEIEADDVDLTRLNVTRRTVMSWEKMFPGRGVGMLSDQSQIKYSHLYELAYVLARPMGLPHTAKFSEFCDAYEVDSVSDTETSDGTVDPTQVGHSTEP